MRRCKQAGILLFVLFGFSGALRASGTYGGSSSSTDSGLDRALYAEGKHIYTGKIVPAGDSPEFPSDGADRLKNIEGRLPPKVRTSANLERFVGKLTARQLESLEYYLSVRYKLAPN